MSNNDKLGNPAAIALLSTPAGQKGIGKAVDAGKLLLLVVGGALTVRYAYGKYKDWRAEKYARDNAGNPNLIAAAIIYDSFTRIGFPDSSILSWLISEIDISTDEAALNDIASQVTNPEAVAQAYKILFDRSLFFDIQKGLDTEELKTFWDIINSPQSNQDTATLYPIGTDLYCAVRNGIIVNIAESNDAGQWEGTSVLYGNFAHNELIGKVIAHGVYNNENYYIVEDCNWFGFDCDTGVVVQNQVTNKKL